MFVSKPRMSHNFYKLSEDLLRPLANFFHEAEIDTEFREGVDISEMRFRTDISDPPSENK